MAVQWDRFLIAPLNTGLQQDLRPWLIMDDAFAALENAYIFRGRLRKRFGSVLMGTSQLTSRLRINLGNLGASPSTLNVPGGLTQLKIGQAFSIGNAIFTVTQLGAGVALLSTSGTISATINSTVNPNTVTFTGGTLGTPVYYYPANPVMGIDQYVSGQLNAQPTYAFDTQFAYTYNAGAWNRSGTAIWQGSNLNFFNVCNWEGTTPSNITMFVSNFNATVPTPAATDDPIWYTQDGAAWTSASGANAFYFAPNGGAVQTGPYVKTARLIVAFKNRLLLLNTVENDNSGGAGVNSAHVNRCRFSFNGSPLARNAWYEPNQTDSSGGVTLNNNIAAGAGWIDATTDEAIISAEFIKDRLIVFFERSTWEIAYTGNDKQPFVWQKINTELGSQSQCSSVSFDKEILTMGNTGVHACNGANVARIDQKIPDQIFDIKDKNLGVQRVAGIRDYWTELVYWTFPAQNANPNFTFPNKLLVYNYKNGSWSINNDSFTAFGYWQQDSDSTWANSAPLKWQEANFQWNSGSLQQQFRQIIAGNAQGFMQVIRPDVSRNSASLQITNISASGSILTITAINHTLDAGDFVLLENVNGTGAAFLNNKIFKITSSAPASNTFTIAVANYTGTYTGGGTIARVSNYKIQSKQWNPYDKLGRNVSVGKIDFIVQNTVTGQLFCEYFISDSYLGLFDDAEPGSVTGTSIIEMGPYPNSGINLDVFTGRLIRPVYLWAEGISVQIQLSMTDDQMTTNAIALADLELEGLILYTRPTSNRLF